MAGSPASGWKASPGTPTGARGSRALLLTVLFVLALTPSRLFGVDLARREALQLERDGDGASAAAMYRSWLGKNTRSPSLSAVLNDYFRTEQDPQRFVQVYAALRKGGNANSLSAGVLERVGQLLEMLGQLPEARQAYLESYERWGSAATLASAFFIAWELGDSAAASEDLARARSSGQGGDQAFDACMALQSSTGGLATAPSSGTPGGPASSGSTEPLPLKALWCLYLGALERGEGESAARIEAEIRSRFGKSPEGALAEKSPAVILSPTPRLFLGATSAPTGSEGPTATAPVAAAAGGPLATAGAAAASAATPAAAAAAGPAATSGAAAPAASFAVQAGAFLMKENAEDLVDQLAKRGFGTVVREDTSTGKTMYKVFAGTDLPKADAEAVVQKLHAAGFAALVVSK